jgi:hypothetical protein
MFLICTYVYVYDSNENIGIIRDDRDKTMKNTAKYILYELVTKKKKNSFEFHFLIICDWENFKRKNILFYTDAYFFSPGVCVM